MNARIMLLLIFFQALTQYAWSQAEKQKFLSIEVGMDVIGCAAPNKEYIRAVNDQNIDYSSDNIKALMANSYMGLKFEYRVFNNLFGISTGLRYNKMITSIGRDSYQSSGPDYFYVNYNQFDLTTEYAKVCEINQKSDYIGIPLEVRLYSGRDHKIKFYYKAGFSFNLKVQSKTDILFFSESMEQYQADVLKVVEKPTPNFSTMHFGLGLKTGNSTKPGISFETSAPIGIIFPNGSYLVKPLAGIGFQFILSIPINTK